MKKFLSATLSALAMLPWLLAYFVALVADKVAGHKQPGEDEDSLD